MQTTKNDEENPSPRKPDADCEGGSFGSEKDSDSYATDGSPGGGRKVNRNAKAVGSSLSQTRSFLNAIYDEAQSVQEEENSTDAAIVPLEKSMMSQNSPEYDKRKSLSFASNLEVTEKGIISSPPKIRQVETSPSLVSSLKKPKSPLKPAGTNGAVGKIQSKPKFDLKDEPKIMTQSSETMKQKIDSFFIKPVEWKQDREQIPIEIPTIQVVKAQSDSEEEGGSKVSKAQQSAASQSAQNSKAHSTSTNQRDGVRVPPLALNSNDFLPLKNIDEIQDGSFCAKHSYGETEAFESSISGSQSLSQSHHVPVDDLQQPHSGRCMSVPRNNSSIKVLGSSSSPQKGLKIDLKPQFFMQTLQVASGGPAFRKMNTNVDKRNNIKKLALPLKRKNSGTVKASPSEASRLPEYSVNANEHKNSRHGKSDQSYLTFAPTVEVPKPKGGGERLRAKKMPSEDYNLKINKAVDEDEITPKRNVYSNKRIYSKEDFKTYFSLKSVLKPRMIYLVKDARDQRKAQTPLPDPDCSINSPEPLQSKPALEFKSEVDEPITSNSSSVYSHVRENYLETNESLAMDMFLDKDAYHMKHNFGHRGDQGLSQGFSNAANIPIRQNQLYSPQKTSSKKLFSLGQMQNDALSERQGYQNRRPAHIQTDGSMFMQHMNQDSPLRLKIDLSPKLRHSNEENTKSPYRKKKIKRKIQKSKLTKDKHSDDSFDIRDEISISDDDDQNNIPIEGMFLYYFLHKTYFIVHKRKIQGYTLNSFNKLGFDSSIRQLAIWINEWAWFDRFIIFLIILNSLGLGLLNYQYTNSMVDNPDLILEMPFLNYIMQQLEFFFTVAFTMEMVIKTVATGVIMDKNCYLRDYWNIMDSVVVMGSILAYLPGVTNVTVLRTFRLFKPLRSLRTLPSMQELVITLLSSVNQLKNIFMLLEFGLILFSILGLQIWRGLTYKRCRLTESPIGGLWPIDPDNQKVCGGLNTCAIDDGQVCGSQYDDQWQDVTITTEPPMGLQMNWGITNFDNIFNAYISMFQATTLEGWYHLMNIFADGYDQGITVGFFTIAILVCYYLLVNLTLAVMVCNLRQQNTDEFNEYIDERVMLERQIEERKRHLQLTLKEEKTSYTPTLCLRWFLMTFISFKDEVEPLAARYEIKFVLCLWRLTIHPLYKAFFIVVVIMNVVVLSLHRHEEATDEYYARMNRDSIIMLVSNVLFLTELMIKIIALEKSMFFETRLNIMDIFLCLIFSILFAIDQSNSSNFSLSYEDLELTNRFTFLAAFRLLRLLIVARESKTLCILLDCVAQTLDAIGNFLVLLLIFLYVYSLLGMQLFAGRLKFDSDGKKIGAVTSIEQLEAASVPRSNFDDIGQSFITVFQILIGERWNEIFYDCWRGKDSLSASGYFITLIFFGNIIMMNLFLAMLLGNFERANLRSQVAAEKAKLSVLMPSMEISKSTEKDKIEEEKKNQKPMHSILKQETDFGQKQIEMKKKKKQKSNSTLRFARENTNNLKRSNSDSGQCLYIPPPLPIPCDSSFDSEQDIEIVREKYKDTKLDSERAQLDRRVSFAAYASDPFFGIPDSSEKTKDKELQLNHFYDEPSPELLQQLESNTLNLGHSRPRAYSTGSNSIELPQIRSRRPTATSTTRRKSFMFGQREHETNKMSAIQEVQATTKNFKGTTKLNRRRSSNENQPDYASVLKRRKTENTPRTPQDQSGEISEDIPIRSISHQMSSERGLVSGAVKFGSAQSHMNNFLSASNSFLNRQAIGKRIHFEDNQNEDERQQTFSEEQTTQHELMSSKGALEIQVEKKPAKRHPYMPTRQKLTVDTGDNPLKMDQKRKEEDLKLCRELGIDGIYSDDETVPPMEKLNQCWDYMKLSSFFCCHKRKRCRKRLVLLVCGGSTQPLFKTVDQLVHFYSQELSKKQKIGKVQEELIPGVDEVSSSSEEEVEPDELDYYKNMSENDRFLDDPNSSGYIEQVLRIQTCTEPKFSEEDLRAQANQIKLMQENGHYEHIFIGNVLKDHGMFYLSEEHDIKIKFPKWYTVSSNTCFMQFMNVCVLLSSLMLAFDDPFAEPGSLQQQILFGCDLSFTLIFLVEAIIKILALGLCTTSLRGKNKKAYFQVSWNRLDIFLVFVQLVDLFKTYLFSSESSKAILQGFKALKAMRALRPLRMIARFKGLRIAMQTIVASGQQIFNVVLLSVAVIIIFAVIGVQMFKGTFFRCVIDGDSEIAKLDDLIDTKDDCLNLGHQWQNPPDHFDNLYYAIRNMMVFMTNEGWVTVMHSAVDSRGVDQQPKVNASLESIIYFILYMVVSHVFILNLFVGVIIQRFNTMHESLQGMTHNTVKKRKWIDIQRLMMKQKLQTKWFIPARGLQRYCALISLSKPFEIFIYTIIIANVIVLGMPYHGMSETYFQILEYLGFSFSIVYNIEAVIKLNGLRGRYFHENWNILDLLIVITSNVGVILDKYTNVQITVMIPMIRALRVARMLKLVRGSQGLKMLVESVGTLFSNLIDIFGLMLLLVYIFAVLGINIFHGVMFKEHYNEYTNFRTFGNSLLLLLRCVTGEGWNLLMNDLHEDDGLNGVQCIPDQSYDDWQRDGVMGCGSGGAFMFFLTFVVLAQMVFINLFIAFVLQAYMNSYNENVSMITIEDYAKLTELWQDYDPKATGLIDPQDVAFLVYELVEPLGKKEDYQDIMKDIIAQNEVDTQTNKPLLEKNQRYIIKVEKNMIMPVSYMTQTLDKLRLPIYITNEGHKCHFKDVCIQLTIQALKQRQFFEENDKITEEEMLMTEWQANYAALKTQVKLEDQDSGTFWAGIFIARIFRQIQSRKKHRKKSQKKAECISEFNKRKAYSKMLREMDDEARQEELKKHLNEQKQKKNLSKYELQLLQQTDIEKGVSFHNNDEDKDKQDENSPVIIDEDVQIVKQRLEDNTLDGQLKMPNSRFSEEIRSLQRKKKQTKHFQRDIGRSGWWKDKRDWECTNKKLNDWILINDIRYGREAQREKEQRHRELQTRLGIMKLNLQARSSSPTPDQLKESNHDSSPNEIQTTEQLQKSARSFNNLLIDETSNLQVDEEDPGVGNSFRDLLIPISRASNSAKKERSNSHDAISVQKMPAINNIDLDDDSPLQEPAKTPVANQVIPTNDWYRLTFMNKYRTRESGIIQEEDSSDIQQSSFQGADEIIEDSHQLDRMQKEFSFNPTTSKLSGEVKSSPFIQEQPSRLLSTGIPMLSQLIEEEKQQKQSSRDGPSSNDEEAFVKTISDPKTTPVVMNFHKQQRSFDGTQEIETSELQIESSVKNMGSSSDMRTESVSAQSSGQQSERVDLPIFDNNMTKKQNHHQQMREASRESLAIEEIVDFVPDQLEAPLENKYLTMVKRVSLPLTEHDTSKAEQVISDSSSSVSNQEDKNQVLKHLKLV